MSTERKTPQKHQKVKSLNLNYDSLMIHQRNASNENINLRNTVRKISKSLYKNELKQDYISKLERLALRNQGSDFTEPKSPTRPKIDPTLLSVYLKVNHQPRPEGMQIIKLPKTPFGKHRNYNNEREFVERHFLSADRSGSSPERIKEFEEINRKYRLQKKRTIAVKNKYHMLLTPNHNQTNELDAYHMKTGFLYCHKQDDIVTSYDTDRKKYLIVKKALDSSKDFNSHDSSKDKTKCKTAVSRLYRPYESPDSAFSRQLTKKYSLLFAENEGKRPSTSFVRNKN